MRCSLHACGKVLSVRPLPPAGMSVCWEMDFIFIKIEAIIAFVRNIYGSKIRKHDFTDELLMLYTQVEGRVPINLITNYTF